MRRDSRSEPVLAIGLHAAVFILLTIAGVIAAGCRATPARAGDSKVSAAYRMGILRAELPMDVRPVAVLAAADQTLRNRGYAVDYADRTEEGGEVRGRAPAGGTVDWGDVFVRSRVTARATRVEVQVFTFDAPQAKSQAVMDAVLRQLGR